MQTSSLLCAVLLLASTHSSLSCPGNLVDTCPTPTGSYSGSCTCQSVGDGNCILECDCTGGSGVVQTSCDLDHCINLANGGGELYCEDLNVQCNDEHPVNPSVRDFAETCYNIADDESYTISWTNESMALVTNFLVEGSLSLEGPGLYQGALDIDGGNVSVVDMTLTSNGDVTIPAGQGCIYGVNSQLDVTNSLFEECANPDDDNSFGIQLMSNSSASIKGCTFRAYQEFIGGFLKMTEDNIDMIWQNNIVNSLNYPSACTDIPCEFRPPFLI